MVTASGRAANPASLLASLEQNTKQVHDFIAAWFRGDVSDSAELFDRELTQFFAPELINIQPSGRALTQPELLSSIRHGYASNPAFHISISDFRCLQSFPAGHVILATYLETQTAARNTSPPNNQRIASVIFRLPADGSAPLWLHIHETGLTL